MSWMELFEILVNGLSILDYCSRQLRPRGCKGLGFGSENKCESNLFIQINFRVCLRILSTFKSTLNHLLI